MNLNLYQQHRPRKWSEVVGHEITVKDLLTRSKEKKLPHVSFIHSPSGIGKTTIARLIAMSITCTNLKDGEPCGQCKFCLDIINESFVLAVHPYNASNLKVDEMRELDNDARTISATSPVKVIIIDEFQELEESTSKKAQKNILPLLEAKLSDVYFILLSMRDDVNSAVVDRSVYYKLNPAPVRDVANHLVSILKKEKIEFDEKKHGTVLAIAENCKGSFRRAIAWLERCIVSDMWDENVVVEELGIVTQAKLEAILTMWLDNDLSFFNYFRVTADIAHQFRLMLLDQVKILRGIKKGKQFTENSNAIILHLGYLNNLIRTSHYLDQPSIEVMMFEANMKVHNNYSSLGKK